MGKIDDLQAERDILASIIADTEAELDAAGIPAEDRHGGLTLAGRVKRLAEAQERAEAACVALRLTLKAVYTTAMTAGCPYCERIVGEALAAPDPGADILAAARAVTAAAGEFLSWVAYNRLVDWEAEPARKLHAALARAKAHGWTEPPAGGEKPCEP